MQLVCYVGIAAEFRWVCAECQQRGFSNYRADQPAAWGTGISTFAISAGLSGVRFEAVSRRFRHCRTIRTARITPSAVRFTSSFLGRS